MFNAQIKRKEFNMTNKPTITRFSAGLYYFTGWVANRLVQYSILKTQEGWKITRTYGEGFDFYLPRKTKRNAINAILGKVEA